MSQFIQDGHKILFALHKDSVVVERVECPFDNGATGSCNAGRSGCVVRTFINVYETEFCMGSASIVGPVEIAWAAAYGESDLDASVGAIWFIPIEDEEYQAMLKVEAINALTQ